jgi:protein-S-isoprenylcysteine O-methyltransferase Ste14
MHISKGLFLTSVVLGVGGASGVLATWSLAVGGILLLAAALIGAIASEERDLRANHAVDEFARLRSELATPPRAAA